MVYILSIYVGSVKRLVTLSLRLNDVLQVRRFGLYFLGQVMDCSVFSCVVSALIAASIRHAAKNEEKIFYA